MVIKKVGAVNFIFYLLSVAALCVPATLFAQNKNSKEQTDMPYNLAGKPGWIILKNSTTDLIKLSGEIVRYLPIYETNYNEVLKPGQQDTLTFNLPYPDLATFHPYPFRIYVVPGKTIVCDIGSIKPLNIKFSGEFSHENQYYFAFDKYFQNIEQDSQPYYKAGDGLSDLNEFPAKADSINNLSLKFLKQYTEYLPAGFKEHEYQRLMYNCGFRKYHVLFSKEFSIGQKIPIRKSYYDFENKLAIDEPVQYISTAYLWYAVYRIRKMAIDTYGSDIDISIKMLQVINTVDSGMGSIEALKARVLFDIYNQSKFQFTSLLNTTHFKDTSAKNVIDSLAKIYYSEPLIGKKAPELVMLNLNDDRVSLNSCFKGRYVIINFWATWCDPCIKEISYENKLANQYKDLTVINLCVESEKNDWIKLSNRDQIHTLNFFITPQEFIRVKRLYNLVSYPRSILLNSKFEVVDNYFKKASLIKNNDFSYLLKIDK